MLSSTGKAALGKIQLNFDLTFSCPLFVPLTSLSTWAVSAVLIKSLPAQCDVWQCEREGTEITFLSTLIKLQSNQNVSLKIKVKTAQKALVFVYNLYAEDFCTSNVPRRASHLPLFNTF